MGLQEARTLKERDVCPYCGKPVSGEPEFCPKCHGRLGLKQPWYDVALGSGTLPVCFYALSVSAFVLGILFLSKVMTIDQETTKGLGSLTVGLVFLIVGLIAAKRT